MENAKSFDTRIVYLCVVNQTGSKEILENFGSTQTGDIAFKLTDHYSPIVRWRALSSLNKSADPRTEDVLVAFCADPVSFIQEGARQALGKAGRKA